MSEHNEMYSRLNGFVSAGVTDTKSRVFFVVSQAPNLTNLPAPKVYVLLCRRLQGALKKPLAFCDSSNGYLVLSFEQ